MPDTKENGKPVAHTGGTGANASQDDTQRLNKRIQRHYDVTSDQFLKVWGEHIHHGLFTSPTDTNAQAQLNQVARLAESANLSAGSRVLDVGCGIGGTARYLARERGCVVTAVTNSRRQVEIARGLTRDEVARIGAVGLDGAAPDGSPSSLAAGAAEATAGGGSGDGSGDDFVRYPNGGAVRVLELDAEVMRERLSVAGGERFDCVWTSEVVFHLRDRQLLFDSAFALLDPGGCLVMADIFRTERDPESASKRVRDELASIRRNHLCPELGTTEEYAEMARVAGLRERHGPVDITENVAKTWDVPLPMSSLLFIIFRGRDTIGYWRGMRSMKKAYAHGTAIYAILCFEKP